MTKIKNFLVPLDGSKNSLRGLDQAIYLARHCNGVILGLHIKKIPAIYAIHPLGFLGVNMAKESKKILDSAKTRCAKKGIMFKGTSKSGADPGYDIIKFAKSKKIDYIVIGARGMGSIKEAFLGSTSHYVLHKSKKPVLLVK